MLKEMLSKSKSRFQSGKSRLLSGNKIKKTKNSISLIAVLGAVFILQGCYTQMESTKKVRVNSRPAYDTKTYTYTLPAEIDSSVYYQDEDGNVYYQDEYGNINYVENDSVFSVAYQKGFAIQTPLTTVKEYHHYYYDDPFTYDPYYDNFRWNVSFSLGNRYYSPYRYYNYWPYYGDSYYTGWYGNYSYYDPYWGYSPWYSYNHGYYWTHNYNNYWGGYWYGDHYGYNNYNKYYNRDKRDWDRRGSDNRERDSYRSRNNTTNDYGYTKGVSNPVSGTRTSASKQRAVIKRVNSGTEQRSPRKSSGSEIKRTRTRTDDAQRNNTKQNTKSNTKVRSTNRQDTNSNLNRTPRVRTNSVRVRTQATVRPNTQKSNNRKQIVQRSTSRKQVTVNRSSTRQNVRQTVSNKRSAVKSYNTVQARPTVRVTKARTVRSKAHVSTVPSRKATSSKSYTNNNSSRNSSSRATGSPSYRSNSGSRSYSKATSTRNSSSGNSNSRSRRK